mmetsp:Transcript_3912/g.9340  ORF Transcript_3912/g.9340 Transcript_3912/m.9340 type:complete len:221 (-) Transcript_3912:2330-2992(-)
MAILGVDDRLRGDCCRELVVEQDKRARGGLPVPSFTARPDDLLLDLGNLALVVTLGVGFDPADSHYSTDSDPRPPPINLGLPLRDFKLPRHGVPLEKEPLHLAVLVDGYGAKEGVGEHPLEDGSDDVVLSRLCQGRLCVGSSVSPFWLSRPLGLVFRIAAVQLFGEALRVLVLALSHCRKLFAVMEHHFVQGQAGRIPRHTGRLTGVLPAHPVCVFLGFC